MGIQVFPLEATYLPTGQKILFRGLDDPLKVTSITVEYGYLCWAWLKSLGSRKTSLIAGTP